MRRSRYFEYKCPVRRPRITDEERELIRLAQKDSLAKKEKRADLILRLAVALGRRPGTLYLLLRQIERGD